MTPLPRGLKTLTRVVRWGTAWAAAFFVIAPLWLVSSLERVRDAAPALTGLAPQQMFIDDRARWLGLGAGLPGILASLFALWQLWHLFGLYAQGQFFAAAPQARLRGFAWALLAASLFAPATNTLLGLVYTVGMPPHEQMLVLGLSGEHVLAILTSAVFLAIAVVLSEASRLAEENGQFV